MAEPVAAAPVRVSTAVPLALAVGSGVALAVQQQLNGALGRQLGNPLLAAVVSFGSGLLVVALFVLVRRGTRRSLARLLAVPWWCTLGGVGGASLVAVGATAAPKIGVALLTVGLVGGLTVGGLVVDRAGLGPGGPRPVTGARLGGAGLCLLAIAVSAAAGLRSASPLLLVLVVLAGSSTALQQALNGRVRHLTGDAALATLVNFSVGTSVLALGLGVRALAVGVKVNHWPGQWWLYLGGLLGTVFVAVSAIIVKQLGVLRLGLALTAGQLTGGVLLDLGRGVAVSTIVAVGLTMAAVAVSGMQRR